jgi:lipoprotein-anchoring transpeptidase ErfK/SrfK
MFIGCTLSPHVIIPCYVVHRKAAIYLISIFTVILTLLTPVQARENVYPIPENGARLIGQDELYKVKKGDYFHSIAQFYNIGLVALMDANPGIDPFLPAQGTTLKIPTRMLLPDVAYQGIVINLPELRLYYFEKNTNKVYVFPIGIGRLGRETPIMETTIRTKIKNPSWTPTAKIRADYLALHGNELPAVVLAGKNNPLGDYALQLAFADYSYLIHGTNQNFGIGMRVSAGCIRLNPVDIAWLFQQVAKGEPVRIINEPIKVSTEPNGKNILEVHAPLSITSEEKVNDLLWVGDKVKFKNRNKVNNLKVKEALLSHQGLAVNVDQ